MYMWKYYTLTSYRRKRIYYYMYNNNVHERIGAKNFPSRQDDI